MTVRLARKAAAVLTAAAVVLGAAASTASAEEVHAQKVVWAPCKPDPDGPKPPPGFPDIPWEKMDCATVAVPMDYRHPKAGKLRVAVSRLKATNRAKRQGVLLLNPGGPGGGGVFMPLALEESKLAATLDLIGFDPRGVGRSTRLECEVTDGTTFLNRPTDAQMRTIAKEARQREQACKRAGGGIRPFINTANTARDMDVIRTVLGEKKINYLGFSYGTYLGAVYGSLFPSRLNRSVLDSSMHPDWFYYEASKQQAVAARQNYDAWVAWLAERHKTYGFGTSVAAVNATFDALGAKLAAKSVKLPPPVPAGLPAEIDRNTFDQLLGGITPYREAWDFLGQLTQQIRELANARSMAAGSGVALARLAKFAVEQTTSGVFQTVTCEADWPRDLNVYYAQMRKFRTRYPYGPGAMSAAPTECTFRSFTPPERMVKLQRKGYPTGIVVQAEMDRATQYEGGPAMAARLRHNLISVRDEGAHGIYGNNACVTRQVDDYLIDGILPASRSECPGAPRPDVPVDGAAVRKKAATSLESQVNALIAKHSRF